MLYFRKHDCTLPEQETGCQAFPPFIPKSKGGRFIFPYIRQDADALGNPWLMGEIIACLAGRDLPPCPSLPERLNVISHHLDMELQYHGEAGGSRRNFRKHLLWYTKSLPGGAKFRKLAVNLKGKESILEELQRFFLAVKIGV